MCGRGRRAARFGALRRGHHTTDRPPTPVLHESQHLRSPEKRRQAVQMEEPGTSMWQPCTGPSPSSRYVCGRTVHSHRQSAPPPSPAAMKLHARTTDFSTRLRCCCDYRSAEVAGTADFHRRNEAAATRGTSASAGGCCELATARIRKSALVVSCIHTMAAHLHQQGHRHAVLTVAGSAKTFQGQQRTCRHNILNLTSAAKSGCACR